MSEKLIISWEEYNRTVEKLAIQIDESEYKPTLEPISIKVEPSFAFLQIKSLS